MNFIGSVVVTLYLVVTLPPALAGSGGIPL